VISRSFRLIEAPSTLGLSTNGVEALPEALLKLGLAERIGASESVRLPVPRKEPARDPSTGVLNAHEIARWSPRLADAVGIVFDDGGFPIVLGGDCTIVLGSMLAFRRRGRYGLLFIDGNADFFQPEAEPKGEGASMDLALVTGFGPSLLTDLEDLRPIVRPEDAVAFGFRDHEDQREYGSQPLPDKLPAFDIHRIRQSGAEQAARDAVDYLTRQDVAGFFVHLDADVLDDAVMPAVDFRVPGGLSPKELATVLKVAIASEKAVGLEVTIYNPRLDRDGRAGHVLVDVLCKVLSAEGSSAP
jgi:arginase